MPAPGAKWGGWAKHVADLSQGVHHQTLDQLHSHLIRPGFWVNQPRELFQNRQPQVSQARS